MEAEVSRRRRKLHSSEEIESDFELNITPIVDCFTVLVAFMLISAASISLGVFHVGVTKEVDPIVTSQPISGPVNSEQKFSIYISEDDKITFQTTGTINKKTTLSLESIPEIEAVLKEIKEQKWGTFSESVMNAHPQAKYKSLIKALETIRTTLPQVYIGEAQTQASLTE